MTRAGYQLSEQTRSRRRASSLLELVVVLALLGILMAVTSLAIVPPRSVSADDALAQQVLAARSRAISTGVPHTIVVTPDAETPRLILAQPDGSVLGALPRVFDALSGTLLSPTASSR